METEGFVQNTIPKSGIAIVYNRSFIANI
jgi:hypothetical protein